MGGSYNRDNSKYKLNPVPSFNFALEVEAVFFMPLKAVRVFTKENEFEYYQEGGLNDYVHMLRKPISRPFTFQVERYVGVSATTDFNASFIDPIAMGTELILPVVLYVTHLPAGDSGDNFSFTNTTRAYIFTGCTVISKEYGELNAERSGLLTDVTTISYRELMVMNTLNPSWEGGEQWEFDKKDISSNFLGEGKAHTENRAINQDKKKAVSIWAFDENNSSNYKGVITGDQKNHSSNKKEGGPHVPPSKWEYDGTLPGGGTPHEQNRTPDQDKKPPVSLWKYDGTVAGGGAHHDQNKKPGGTPPTPVIWPPTRRAQMANELMK
ncbi:MAG: phage tail protein [Lachnospiraceae bacterium]|nr:phage tail protein [Lachnospiraceae bacterium]